MHSNPSMKIKLLFIILLISSQICSAQRIYKTSQTEFIFSSASLNPTSIASSNVVRFSGFINHEGQRHVNFNNRIGYYTGIGIKNIGMINRFGIQDINFKQRAYAISIPFALKFGRIQRQSFMAVGVDINFLFHYKEKFLYNDTLTKQSEWFSKKVKPIQPAVFFQIKYLKSQIITFKYFLNDFLRYQPGGLALPDGSNVTNYGRSSHIFYISWGTSLEFKDKIDKPLPKRIRTASLE